MLTLPAPQVGLLCKSCWYFILQSHLKNWSHSEGSIWITFWLTCIKKWDKSKQCGIIFKRERCSWDFRKCVCPLWPRAQFHEDKVPVVNVLSRFKKPISDLERPLMHNQSLFPMKFGSSTALPHRGFFQGANHFALSFRYCNDAGHIWQCFTAINAYTEERKVWPKEWDIPQRNGKRPYKRRTNIKTVCKGNSLPPRHTHTCYRQTTKKCYPHLAHFNGVFFVPKCSVRRGLNAVYNYNSLMGGCRAESQTLLKCTRLEGQERKHRMEHSSLQLSVRKSDFHHKSVQPLPQGPREAEVSPPLQILKTQWAKVPSMLIWLQGGLDYMTSGKPPPTSGFCWDSIKVCMFPFTTGVFFWISI